MGTEDEEGVLPSVKSLVIILTSREVKAPVLGLPAPNVGVTVVVRRSDEAVCVCVCVYRCVYGDPPPFPSSGFPAHPLHSVVSGSDVQLLAGVLLLTCSPHPELLFMTNCFVCSV